MSTRLLLTGMKATRQKGTDMKSKIAKGILTFILVLTVIAALGFAMGLHSLTIIEWWQPAALSGIIAIPLSIWLARFIKPVTRDLFKYMEYPCSFVLTFSIILAAFYSANFYLSDHTSGYEYKAPVVRKYRQERTQTQKIGRRGYKEYKYSVYIIELQMSDGKIKKMEKTLSEYNKIKKGSSINLFIEDGLFSIPVIKPRHKSSQNQRN